MIKSIAACEKKMSEIDAYIQYSHSKIKTQEIKLLFNGIPLLRRALLG